MALAGLLLVSSLVPMSVAADVGDIGHAGPSYAGSSTSTGEKPQSKLWFNDGFWWGALWDTDTADLHIHRLDLTTSTWVDTGVRLEDRGGTRADVLWDGTKLYVASHRFSSTNASGYAARLYRYSYNTVSQTYTLDAGFPAQIHNFRVESMVIDKDSTGTLWATWPQNSQIMISHTNGSDSSWVTPYVLPAPGSTVAPDDISSVVAFRRSGGPGQIGLVWSNQVDDKMYFAIHNDGDPDNVWDTSKVALQGPGVADDHINLKSVQADGSGRIYAAVKTSHTSGSSPLIMVLVFDPATGQWSSSVAGRVSDSHTRPIVVIDDEQNEAHVFMTGPQPPSTSGQAGGSIYEKTAPLGTLAFASGVGTAVIRDASSPDMNDATSTKQNVNSTTGLVVLASNDTTDQYWWHYDPLGGTPPAAEPPVASFTGTPTSGSAPLTVSFTDTSTNLPSSWAWDFDNDGTTDSTAQHPSHEYTAPGTYTVKLTATNAAGADAEVRTDYVSVGAPLTFKTFTPVADSFVSSASVTKNYGNDVSLRIRNSTTVYRSYLKFTPSGLLGPVKSATLRLWVNDASPDGGSVYAVGSTWTETGITWNNAPALPSTPIVASGATPPIGTWHEVNVTPAVAANGTFSFAIASGSTNSAYYSSRTGLHAPQLIVGYEPGGSAPVAPVADFTADPTGGSVPLTVTFHDTSTNEPTTWAWDFESDGTVDSTAQNPVHTYMANGAYNVTLTASNGAGSDSEVKTSFITIDGPTPTPTPSVAPTPTPSVAPTPTPSVAPTPTPSSSPSGTPTSPPGGALEFTPIADSRTLQSAPTSKTGGTSVDLRVRLDATGSYRSYLKFDVSGLSGSVGAVTLRLFCTDASPDGGTVYPTSSAWEESTLTWGTQPAATGAAIRDVGAVAAGTWVDIDLTGSITGNGTYSFLISDGNTNSALYSSREGANPPQLRITQAP